jgi:tRNA threonylcarbamoyladenosine biosynthesis protein TsaE
MRVWTTASPEETEALGRRLAAELAPDGVLLLGGDLGAGKTVLARGVAAGLGIDPNEVQSPTFVIVREHGDDLAGDGPVLVHVDLYRLEPEEVPGVGIEELLAGPGVKVVEWAERLPWDPAELVSGPVLSLSLERLEAEGFRRRITERALGSRQPIA